MADRDPEKVDVPPQDNNAPPFEKETSPGPDTPSDESVIDATSPALTKDTPISAPPNGGLAAWTQVVGAFFLFFNSWGIVNTFGAYQYFYETSLLSTHQSSQISWIGTFEAFLLVVLSIIIGPIFDRGYFRSLLVVGTFFTVFGLMMTSISTKYWQIFLAQGLCVGIGGGCLFLPSVAIVATYFTTRRALATGVTAAGGSIGSMLYPIIFRRLQPRIGFGWTTRVIAFIALATLAISIVIMKTRIPPPKKARALLDLGALRSVPFTIVCCAVFFCFVGLYVPIFYIVVYAQVHANVDIDMSFYLLSILNASSVFGRVLPGIVADKVGGLETMIFFAFGCATFAYAWMAIHTLAGLIVFAIVYGFLSGAVVSLPPAIIAKFVPEMRFMGTWMGMSFCFAGVGILIGSPIAGTIINVAENKFSGGLIFSGSCTMVGAILFVISKVLKVREERKE